MIEINGITDPIKIQGHIGDETFTFFRSRDHWVFYVSGDSIATATCEYIFALSGKYPARIAMPKMLAIKIAWACAKHYEKQFID